MCLCENMSEIPKSSTLISSTLHICLLIGMNSQQWWDQAEMLNYSIVYPIRYDSVQRCQFPTKTPSKQSKFQFRHVKCVHRREKNLGTSKGMFNSSIGLILNLVSCLNCIKCIINHKSVRFYRHRPFSVSKKISLIAPLPFYFWIVRSDCYYRLTISHCDCYSAIRHT